MQLSIYSLSLSWDLDEVRGEGSTRDSFNILRERPQVYFKSWGGFSSVHQCGMLMCNIFKLSPLRLKYTCSLASMTQTKSSGFEPTGKWSIHFHSRSRSLTRYTQPLEPTTNLTSAVQECCLIFLKSAWFSTSVHTEPQPPSQSICPQLGGWCAVMWSPCLNPGALLG